MSLLLTRLLGHSQFDFYGPAPFSEIQQSSFSFNTWNQTTIPTIENKRYVIILDEATKTKALMIDNNDKTQINFLSTDSITGANATYGSLMRSIFQLVDINTQEENGIGAGSGTFTPLNNDFKVTPFFTVITV